MTKAQAAVVIGLAVIGLVLFDQVASSSSAHAGAQRASNRPSLSEVMDTCNSTAGEEAGSQPATPDQVGEYGGDATDQFNADLADIDYIGKVQRLRVTCIEQDTRFTCGGTGGLAGCWPVGSPAAIEYFDPTAASVAKTEASG